ncbi:MAG: phosphonatase-like hydrolase [Corynebacterium camporealensis]|uniref:phosphonatase-like hydrolase n=1 Tax=Corynebacterium camporealensis TaxID=161896 RepID=UPI002A90AD89|nr:phosphonatase-like hydrolase [Corynebacterium camporealensis]MDY5840841.1 phosphonatase-like hydrolase [Corynebacterium camporealensis]
MKKLAIFDMAGTTIDDRDEVYRVLRQAAEREGAQFSDETFQEYMGTEKYWAIGKLLEVGNGNQDNHDTTWEWFREELRRTYTENPPQPLPGIEDMFATLHQQGIKIGLTTGFSREIVDLILKGMGWDTGVIDASAAGDEVSSGRPAPLLIEKVMEDTGITDNAEVVSVGDTQADVESAHRAGVTSVGVLTGHLTREEFQKHCADHVLDSAADVVQLLSSED